MGTTVYVMILSAHCKIDLLVLDVCNWKFIIKDQELQQVGSREINEETPEHVILILTNSTGASSHKQIAPSLAKLPYLGFASKTIPFSIS